MLRFVTSLLLAVTTYAYQQDLAKLPNGNSYGLTLGHPGGVTRKATNLASSFYANGQKWDKAICQADADGDGQTNGFEMGDPCCKWSIGQTPMFTTGLSDPNSAASKSIRPMPTCMTNLNIFNVLNIFNILQCSVCIQALQLDLNKPSADVAEFTLTSVKSCKDATQNDNQQLLCVKTLIGNAKQLFADQKNGVNPLQSCMNLGLITCMAPPTMPPPSPTLPPTLSPTNPPTPKPTAPLPPYVQSIEFCEPPCVEWWRNDLLAHVWEI